MLSAAMLDAERVKIEQAELAIEAEEKGVKLEQATRAERNKVSLETARMMQSAQTPRGRNKTLMAKTVFDVLKDKIEGDKSSALEFLGSGGAKDFARIRNLLA
jgi:hypothetical protein